ncbi:hypothetical protein KC926_02495 [Candidatus Kaiserbacteria bacterium]|nr:hypothetical protein [Candidatus Kaiserbacteria bacterium]
MANVFIVRGDESGIVMYIEMGAALASGARVYAVGKCNNVTVFHFHPSVKRVNSFADVLDDLKTS